MSRRADIPFPEPSPTENPPVMPPSPWADIRALTNARPTLAGVRQRLLREPTGIPVVVGPTLQRFIVYDHDPKLAQVDQAAANVINRILVTQQSDQKLSLRYYADILAGCDNLNDARRNYLGEDCKILEPHDLMVELRGL